MSFHEINDEIFFFLLIIHGSYFSSKYPQCQVDLERKVYINPDSH